MCRLGFFPPGTRIDNATVKELVQYLVSFQGGDGAGVATYDKDGKVVGLKGVKEDAETLLKFMKENDKGNGWLFHSRMASSGQKVSELNQPFETPNYLFVHNGHWTDWTRAYWPLLVAGELEAQQYSNDSRTVAALVERLGPDVVWKLGSGVFLTWKKGEKFPFANVVGGSFSYSGLQKKDGGGLIYASSFPREWKKVVIYEFKNDTVAELTPGGPKISYGEKPFKTIGTGSAKDGWHRNYIPGGRGYSEGYMEGTD